MTRWILVGLAVSACAGSTREACYADAKANARKRGQTECKETPWAECTARESIMSEFQHAQERCE